MSLSTVLVNTQVDPWSTTRGINPENYKCKKNIDYFGMLVCNTYGDGVVRFVLAFYRHI